jgi:hypothetical protein
VIENNLSALFGLIDLLHQVDAQNFVSAMVSWLQVVQSRRMEWFLFRFFFVWNILFGFSIPAKNFDEKREKKLIKFNFMG